MGKEPPLLTVPPSKSFTHRALICAALAGEKSQIQNPLLCEDTLVTHRILSRMWEAPGKKQIFNCVESGTTYRLMTAILYALGLPHQLTGNPSLLKRPIKPLTEALQHLGGHCRVEGNTSSQFLSALLLAAPLMKTQTTIELTTPLVSKPYVEMTLAVQQAFGISVKVNEHFTQLEIAPQPYSPTNYTVEGDWSSASFLIAAGLVKSGCRIQGLCRNSLQADKEILTIVQEMGGHVEWEGKTLHVFSSQLRPTGWDFSQIPDLFPIVSLLNHLAGPEKKLTGIHRLKKKESDRPAAMEQLLKKPENPVDSSDHRIVMAAAILNLVAAQKREILHPEAVAKSYPNFWEDYEQFIG